MIKNSSRYFSLKSNFLTLFFISFLSSICVRAQSVHFNFTNGTETSYNISDIRKITFVDDLMNLHLLDGSIYSWNVSTIGQYEYSESSVNVQEIVNKVNAFHVSVFPNPVSNSLQIVYNLPIEDNISIVLYDLQGKLINEKNIGKQSTGEHQEIMDVNNLSEGVYLCLIKGKQNSITKRVIKN